MRAREGPALWGSELQGPSGMWQPACPLPLCDLAGPAPLAPDHQDTPQHEECHQGEVSHVPPSLSHLSPKPCRMACVQRRIILGNSDWSGSTSSGPKPSGYPGLLSSSLHIPNPSTGPMGSTCIPHLKPDHSSEPHHTFLAKVPLCLTWTFPPLLSLSHSQGSTQPTEQNDLLSLLKI